MATLATSEGGKSGLALEEQGPTHLSIPSPSIDGKHVLGAPHNDDFEDGEFQDVADDRFSMIPLQTPSASPRVPHFRETGESVQTLSRLRNSSVSSLTGQKSPRESLQPLSPSSTHQTTPAPSPYDSSRASSFAAMPIMMARQKERLDSDPNAHRASVDGHARLKVGFEKIQQDSRRGEADIDWGELYMYHHVDRELDVNSRLFRRFLGDCRSGFVSEFSVPRVSPQVLFIKTTRLWQGTTQRDSPKRSNKVRCRDCCHTELGSSP